MWFETNERFLDRHGCGDEFFIDADLKASSWLAGLQGNELFDNLDMLDDSDDVAAH